MSQDWFLPIKRIIEEIESVEIKDSAALEQFRIQYLGIIVRLFSHGA